MSLYRSPWKADGNAVVDADGNYVVDSGYWGGLIPNDVCDLIAAAPELLEACKRMVTLISSSSVSEWCRGTEAQALAAIAKAEGRKDP